MGANRWDWTPDGMIPSDDGEWVDYHSHQQLLSDYAALKAENARLHSELHPIHITDLRGEELREALRELDEMQDGGE